MNHKFFDVSKEKQDRIINAGLRVFALNGYGHASTDEIVRLAAISKGLLFHYFESKLGLYTFLYDYSTRFMMLEINGDKKENAADFFTVIRGMEAACLRALRKYPYMRRFLDSAMTEECAEAAEAIAETRENYREQFRNIFSRIDCACFRSQTDPDRMIRAVFYTLRGLTEEYTRRADYDPQLLSEQITGYLDQFELLLRPEDKGETAPDVRSADVS